MFLVTRDTPELYISIAEEVNTLVLVVISLLWAMAVASASSCFFFDKWLEFLLSFGNLGSAGSARASMFVYSSLDAVGGTTISMSAVG